RAASSARCSEQFASLALGIGRIPHLADRMRLRHQALEIVHEPLSAVFRVFVMPADVNRLLRTHLLAVAAEDAAELVDLEQQRIPVAVLVLARYELDAVRRAHGRAEAARDTLGLAVFRSEHAMRSAPAR